MELPANPDEILAMPLRELAFSTLERLSSASQINRRSFIAEVCSTMPRRTGTSGARRGGPTTADEPEVAFALAEAWEWLRINGLLAPDPTQDPNFAFITRYGWRVVADPASLDED